MEQMVELTGSVWQVVLAGTFALTPGTLFWLAVGGAIVAVQRLKHAEWPATKSGEMKQPALS